MRWWLAVILGLIVGGGLVAAMAARAHRTAAADAEQLLRAALQEGVARPMVAEGEIRVWVARTWQTTPARIEYAGTAARLSLQGGVTPTVMLDDGHRLWQVDPASQTAARIGSSDRKIDWDLFLENYSVKPGSSAVVAGRPASEVRVVSRRYPRRTAMELWIDPGTRLILRRLTYDADGHLVASTELTRVSPASDLDPSELAIPAAWTKLDPEEAAVRMSEDDFEQRAGFAPRWPSYVPQGFQKRGLYANTCPHGRYYAELRYTDGLRVLSVYEHRPRGRGGMGGRGGGPPWSRSEGADGGGGRRQGRGQGRGQGPHHFGQPDARPVLIDRGQAKTVRQRRSEMMVVVTGDLTEQRIRKVIESIPDGGSSAP
jgi:hypothetical protein